jgi:hypothetical protein
MTPDLIVVGRIAGLAGDHGLGWVEAVAITGGRVVEAGRADRVGRLAGADSRWLRLADDEVAMPGITDAHLHLHGAAAAKLELDLSATSSPEDAMRLVGVEHERRRAAGDRDGWILGAGWSIDRWRRWPRAADLDAAAPGRPVALWSHDHHSRVVNRAALARSGLDASGISDPPGGVIGRDDEGHPDGLLYETATTLVDDAIPRIGSAEIERAIVAYAADLLALGVTGVHDPGEIDARPDLRDGPVMYQRMARAGTLPLRVHASVRSRQLEPAIELGLRSGRSVVPDDPHDAARARVADRYRMGWLKLFADGALGSRTAALHEPYEPDPAMPPPAGGPAGMLVTPLDEMIDLVRTARRAGIVTQIHAIGDRAVGDALKALETAGPDGPETPLMPRVEHLQLVADGDVARFARAGVAASVQPIHLRGDAPAARRLWGDRTARAYAWRSLIDAGVTVAIGTDAPVEPADPWPGIAITVTRDDPTWGPEAGAPFHPEQALTLAQAVRAACVGPGQVARDARVGRLVPGSPADMLVLDASVLDERVVAGGALAVARPHATLLDGDIVHRDAAWDREPTRTLR